LEPVPFSSRWLISRLPLDPISRTSALQKGRLDKVGVAGASGLSAETADHVTGKIIHCAAVLPCRQNISYLKSSARWRSGVPDT
jgi:hypothetical protein